MNTQTISAWSFSALSTFEACPYQAKLAKIDKIQPLPRPLPPGGEHANDRGSRIHENFEHHIRNGVKLTRELTPFKDDIEAIKPYFSDGQVELEGLWCFDNAWRPVHERDFNNIWLRVKLDAFIFLDEATALVVDLKTGKRFGNEVKHAAQCNLYQLAAFVRFPQLQKIYTELWYCDIDELARMEFTRNQGMKFLKGFNERGLLMTNTTEFKPKPNQKTCMFCPYGPSETSNKWVTKSGHCKYGV